MVGCSASMATNCGGPGFGAAEWPYGTRPMAFDIAHIGLPSRALDSRTGCKCIGAGV